MDLFVFFELSQVLIFICFIASKRLVVAHAHEALHPS